VGSRISLTRKMAAIALRDRVIELREANVPFRVIAANLKISPGHVRKIYTAYYAAEAAKSGVCQQARKVERRGQLETLDAMTMRWVQECADPAKARAAGYGPREFVAVVEQSRRLKGDLIALDGLAGPNAVHPPTGTAPGEPAVLGDGERENVIIRRFVDGLRDKYPHLFQAFVSEFGRTPNPEPAGASEEGGGGADRPGPDTPGNPPPAGGGPAPGDEPDPGPADA